MNEMRWWCQGCSYPSKMLTTVAGQNYVLRKNEKKTAAVTKDIYIFCPMPLHMLLVELLFIY